MRAAGNIQATAPSRYRLSDRFVFYNDNNHFFESACCGWSKGIVGCHGFVEIL